MNEIEKLIKERDMLEQELKDEEGMADTDPTTLESLEEDLRAVEEKIEVWRKTN